MEEAEDSCGKLFFELCRVRVTVGAVGAAAHTQNFFRQSVLHPHNSIKTCDYYGISPEIDEI